MSNVQLDDLLLGLSRPEYAASPEMLLSALAEKIFQYKVNVDSPLPIGLVYHARQKSSAKKLTILETMPDSSTEEWQGFVADAGLKSDENQELLGMAVLESLKGVQSEKAKSVAALPLTVNLALLQNARGMQGKTGPADYGAILQQMFSLGGSNDETDSIHSLWRSACSRRVQIDRLVAAVDSAIGAALREGGELTETNEPFLQNSLPIGVTASPYHWLNVQWRKLTSDVWVEALPARVWNDWATAVLRLAYGLGYLWEASWYQAIATLTLQNKDPLEVDDVLQEMGFVLPWRSHHEPTSVRDIGPLLNQQLRQGHVVLDILTKASKTCSAHNHVSTVDQRKCLLADKGLREALVRSRGTQSRTVGKQSWEAVRYTLMARSTAQQNGDNYGLFQRVGNSNKYLVVEPTIELVSMIASLACSKPGGTTTLAEVARSLSILGISPNQVELLRILERAGLARGSADADQAVFVSSAF